MTNARTKTTNAALAIAGLALAGTLLAGCGSTRYSSQAASIRSNLSPELATMAERPDDVANTLAIHDSTKTKQLLRDLGTVWYTDRPSRLHRGPSPR